MECNSLPLDGGKAHDRRLNPGDCAADVALYPTDPYGALPKTASVETAAASGRRATPRGPGGKGAVRHIVVQVRSYRDDGCHNMLRFRENMVLKSTIYSISLFTSR